MRRAYYLMWAIPLVGLVLIGRAFLMKVTPLSSGQPQVEALTQEIRGPQRVGQTFNADYPGLTGIAVRFTNWAHVTPDDVVFHLTTWPDTRNELATARVNARLLQDHEVYRFTFAPIPDSQGKVYYFYLESPNAKPGNAVGLTMSKSNVYLGGAAFYDTQALEQDLTFIAYYQPNPLQVAGVFLQRLADKKPWIWGQPAFYVALFALYLALSAAFFWMVLRLAMAGGAEEPEGGQRPEGTGDT